MTMQPQFTVALDGPFFTRDPEKTIRGNIRAMLEALAEQAQTDVRDHFPVGSGNDPHPGAGQAGVIGRVASLSGRPWQLHAVISQQFVYPWGSHRGATIRSGSKRVENRGESQYRGGKLERHLHMFANTARRLNSMRAVTGADITRGID